MKRLQISKPLIKILNYLISYLRWARLSSDLPTIFVIRTIDITEIVTGIKTLLSGEISLASITSTIISSIKLFKTTYNHTTELIKKTIRTDAE